MPTTYCFLASDGRFIDVSDAVNSELIAKNIPVPEDIDTCDLILICTDLLAFRTNSATLSPVLWKYHPDVEYDHNESLCERVKKLGAEVHVILMPGMCDSENISLGATGLSERFRPFNAPEIVCGYFSERPGIKVSQLPKLDDRFIGMCASSRALFLLEHASLRYSFSIAEMLKEALLATVEAVVDTSTTKKGSDEIITITRSFFYALGDCFTNFYQEQYASRVAAAFSNLSGCSLEEIAKGIKNKGFDSFIGSPRFNRADVDREAELGIEIGRVTFSVLKSNQERLGISDDRLEKFGRSVASVCNSYSRFLMTSWMSWSLQFDTGMFLMCLESMVAPAYTMRALNTFFVNRIICKKSLVSPRQSKQFDKAEEAVQWIKESCSEGSTKVIVKENRDFSANSILKCEITEIYAPGVKAARITGTFLNPSRIVDILDSFNASATLLYSPDLFAKGVDASVLYAGAVATCSIANDAPSFAKDQFLDPIAITEYFLPFAPFSLKDDLPKRKKDGAVQMGASPERFGLEAVTFLEPLFIGLGIAYGDHPGSDEKCARTLLEMRLKRKAGDAPDGSCEMRLSVMPTMIINALENAGRTIRPTLFDGPHKKEEAESGDN